MTNAALVDRAAVSIVVADATKLGRSGFARICGISAITTLITDTGASNEQVAQFTDAGIDVVRV